MQPNNLPWRFSPLSWLLCLLILAQSPGAAWPGIEAAPGPTQLEIRIGPLRAIVRTPEKRPALLLFPAGTFRAGGAGVNRGGRNPNRGRPYWQAAACRRTSPGTGGDRIYPALGTRLDQSPRGMVRDRGFSDLCPPFGHQPAGSAGFPTDVIGWRSCPSTTFMWKSKTTQPMCASSSTRPIWSTSVWRRLNGIWW